jgi:hypothetical protein
VISFLTGKPGGGKGLLAMQQLIDELRDGTRPIITSLAVEVEPWVSSDWRPMIGLRQYLLKTYNKDFDVRKRMFLLKEEEAAQFFLWRVIDGKLVKAEAEYKKMNDGRDGCLMSFETELAGRSGGVLYCIDEAWKFWGSRNWQKTGEGMLFYGAQHRKFGDDVLICTQHTKQIDPAIQRVAQDFWVVRNHGKMTFGMFRQPAVFSVCIYDQAPTGASIDPMSRKVFTLDRAGLAQTYDTSAGVGLSGRMMADVGRRGKGLPWWGMIVAVFAVLAGLYFALSFGSKLLTRAMTKGSKPLAKSITAGLGKAVQSTAVGGPPVGGDNSPALPFRSPGGVETNEITCSGYFMMPRGRVVVFLTDGRIADSLDGEVQRVYKRKVEVFGGSFPIRRREPDYQPVQQVPVNLSANFTSVNQDAMPGVSMPVVGMIPSRSALPGRASARSIQSRMQQPFGVGAQ